MVLPQIKNFCPVKETINEMKRPPTEQQNIFENNILYNWLIFKIYKEIIQLNIKKIQLKSDQKF